MDWQLIGLWVGIGITFLLGLFNLFFGGRILTRREKVNIREPELYIDTIERDNGIERIYIRNTFKLVRVRGEQDLHLESAYLQLNNIVLKEMRYYFKISPHGKIDWQYHSFLGSDYDINEI